MKIAVSGNAFLIKNQSNEILHIMSTGVFIQRHPRNETTIVFSKTPSNQDENEGIKVDALKVTEIEGKPFEGDRNELQPKRKYLFAQWQYTGKLL